ncbi:MAG: glycosyltransferase [Ignavibacteria bacterium]|nr:glycosyltransferase [Ignavibacteria bacterium]
MENTLFIVFLSTFLYIVRISFFIIGFIKEYKNIKTKKTSQEHPYVSIIIPARNEECNIKDNLESLTKINYPNDKFEILVVNDRSTDRTSFVVNEIMKLNKNIKLVNIENDAQKEHIPGKAGAVHIGVNNSKGDLIFVTDADCQVQPNWLMKLTRLYNNNQTGFVSSYTNVIGTRLFDKIQAIEWIYMHTMGMGGVGMNIPLGCYGNNITFRKKFYLNFGGYKNISFSVTEDLALQMAFHKNKYEIHYLIDPETIVDTKPCKNLKEYFAQHHRWARGGLNLGWKAVVFVLSSFTFWVGMFYFTILGYLYPVILLLFIRMIGDFALLLSPLSILNKKYLLKYIPIAVPFFLLVELVIPFFTLKKKVKWKNQVFTST